MNLTNKKYSFYKSYYVVPFFLFVHFVRCSDCMLYTVANVRVNERKKKENLKLDYLTKLTCSRNENIAVLWNVALQFRNKQIKIESNF